MQYAEVAVNSPVASRGSFSYSIPLGMEVEVGQAVWVPFGPRLLQGIVVELCSTPQVPQTRDIAAIIEPRLSLSLAQLGLGLWLSQRYFTPLFEAVRPFLPPGFERQPRVLIQVVTPVVTPPPPELEGAWRILQSKKKWRLEAAETALGKARPTLGRFIKLGLVNRTLELEPVRVRPKTAVYLRLAVSPEETEAWLRLPSKSPKRAELLRLLLEQAEPVSIADARQRTGCSLASINSLAKQGWLRKERPKTTSYLRLAVSPEETEAWLRLPSKSPKLAKLLPFLLVQREPVSIAEVKKRFRLTPASLKTLERQGLICRLEVPQTRDPLASHYYSPQLAPVPTPAQQAALEAINAALEYPDSANPRIFLLHGVTGSGKTEVYLRALAKAIALGKRGIVLVPEISLTPQTVQRFASRFPGRVAIMHSRLSLGEQFDEWHRMKKGDFDVVIGSRSAIFAPQPDLGLIVVDEEHEPSYKQDEGPCRYHAREVAIKRAALERAVVVLGSATPDVETFYQAQEGQYRLLSLPHRFSPSGHRPLASVEMVDMRMELKAGNRSIFSRALCQALARTLARGQQAILFLNRRGTATFVQCRDCGFALRCRRCDLALTYHQAEERLVCHQCNYSRRLPSVCPQCHSTRIKYLGLGTQRVEAEVKAAFPAARTLRWDRDVTRGKQSHEAILSQFLAQEADVLIGTQMIAKGLDMPAVTLVGVVMADTSLHFPDFRSGERTFQLISQVAGRAGRGPEAGQVIVQTYSPEHYAIIAGAEQDYEAFFEKEIAYRRQYGNPPFTRLVRLLYSHTSDTRCQREAERLADLLREQKEARGLGAIDIIGPSPAFWGRLRSHYRWQIIIRGQELGKLLAGMPWPRGWSIDVDPMSLL